MFLKRHLWAILYGLLLSCFSAYIILDTFVFEQIYVTVPSTQPQADEGTVELTSDNMLLDPVITDYSYSDGNITITITEYREYDTNIYVADIQVNSVTLLQTAFARNTYGKNISEKTSKIAEDTGAVLAINGDYYGVRENGYVLRNGIVYRGTLSQQQEDLVIFSDGSFSIITEGNPPVDELLESGAWQVLSFGPALMIDGAVSVSANEEVGRARASNPRTAIGILDELHYAFVVTDGRTTESKGLTLYELAEFMHSIGVTTAYNLDGGGSSTLYFRGSIINKPTTSGNSIKERAVSDIVYIGY